MPVQRTLCNTAEQEIALAIYLRDRVPGLGYSFTGTGAKLPETYGYLSRCEAELYQRILRLNAERGCDHWVRVYGQGSGAFRECPHLS
jgi:hypothetical protein